MVPVRKTHPSRRRIAPIPYLVLLLEQMLSSVLGFGDAGASNKFLRQTEIMGDSSGPSLE